LPGIFGYFFIQNSFRTHDDDFLMAAALGFKPLNSVDLTGRHKVAVDLLLRAVYNNQHWFWGAGGLQLARYRTNTTGSSALNYYHHRAGTLPALRQVPSNGQSPQSEGQFEVYWCQRHLTDHWYKASNSSSDSSR